jgi:hypothetical protein
MHTEPFLLPTSVDGPGNAKGSFFFFFFEFTILNNFIINATCGSLTVQTDMLTDLIQAMGRVSRTQSKRQERQALSISQLKRLDTRRNKHWPLKWN